MEDHKIGRWTLQADIRHLKKENCGVIAFSDLPSYGYIIFWFDKQGYSVTSREGNEKHEKAFSISGAMPYDQGLDHYLASISAMAEKRYSR